MTLAGLSKTVADEMQCLERRSTRCPHIGHFTQAWFDLERQRLGAIARTSAHLCAVNWKTSALFFPQLWQNFALELEA